VPALDLALAHWITGRAASVFDLAVGIYPYMLRGLAIDRPNQVWAIDITTCPWRGFIYLAAVMDWFSCRVLSWRVSSTMDAAF